MLESNKYQIDIPLLKQSVSNGNTTRKRRKRLEDRVKLSGCEFAKGKMGAKAFDSSHI